MNNLRSLHAIVLNGPFTEKNSGEHIRVKQGRKEELHCTGFFLIRFLKRI